MIVIKVKNTTGGFFTVYYKHDDTLVARNETNLTSNKVSYYHPDHLGSTTLITLQNGSKSEETNYKPYGEVLIGGEDRFLFTGKELDDESELEYFGARY